jgi:HEAT repeat protein
LARAAAEDPDAEPRVPCCIPTVREAARRALLSEEELRASIVAAARDETLSPEARLRGLNSSVDGRGLGFPLDDETAQAVLDIGRLADDPFVRAQAWYTLSRASPSPEASRTLLDDLTRHSEDKVRAAAASGLRRYADDPAVRAALEQAAADAAPDVRSAARKALGR